MSSQLLKGLRVVEVATFVLGPAAGTVLSDFGADVVHVEHPETGDGYRYLYADATGYGTQGSEVEKPGYDATAWWAHSGLMVEERRAHAADLTAILDDVFAEKPLEQWRAILHRHSVNFGIVARGEELPEDPQMNANGLFRPIEGDPLGTRTLDSPIRIEGAWKRPCGRAPEIGEHSVEVLRELGYAPERIEALRASRAVRAG